MITLQEISTGSIKILRDKLDIEYITQVVNILLLSVIQIAYAEEAVPELATCL